MMIRKIKATAVLFAFVFIVVAGCFLSMNVMALPTESGPIAEKVYYRDLFNCYESSNWLVDTIMVGDFSGKLDSLIKGGASIDSIEQPYIGDEKSRIGCGKVLSEKVAKSYKHLATQNTTEKEQGLKDLYYAFSGGERGGDSGICASYPLKYGYSEKAGGSFKENGYKYTKKVCASEQNGKITFTVSDCSECTDEPIVFENTIENGIDIRKPASQQNDGELTNTPKSNSGETVSYVVKDGTSAGSALAEIGNTVASLLGSDRYHSKYVKAGCGSGGCSEDKRMYHTFWSACGGWIEKENGLSCTSAGGLDIEFGENRNSVTYKKKFDNGIYSFFSNGKYDENSVKFSELEAYVLYQSYLKEIYGVKSISCFDTQQYGKGNKGARLYWQEQSKYSSYCYFDVPDDKVNIKVNGLTGTRYWGKTISLDEMLRQLNGLKVSEPPDSVLDANTDTSGDIPGVDEGSSDPCWNSGIDSMAWVLCPAEKNLEYFAKGIGQFIDSQLATKSNLYETGGSANLAWGYVRTIANALMIILLIVVIFSQLTGFGIDNYGIKKILPKLILMAILINLSFLICQLVIDFSNIIGYGIQQLFYGVGNEIVNTNGDAQLAMSDFIGRLVPALYALAGGGTVIGGFVVTIVGSGSVMGVIVALLTLLSIAAAVLMFFISIGARTVIIIMCAVLSPLAFACYILPNTKPIYKKWFDAFKTALVIYPICGLLIGISYIIKAIAVSQNDLSLAFAVIAGIAPYLPFFMIPSMIKGTLGALGSIGAALSAAGNSFKSTMGRGADTASSAIKNSGAYKQKSEEAARRRTENRNTRMLDRLKKKQDKLDMSGSGKELSKADQMRRLRAQSTLDKIHAEDTAAMTSYYNDRYANASMKTMQEDLRTELSNYRPDLKDAEERKAKINALTNTMFRRDASGAAGAISEMLGKKGTVATPENTTNAVEGGAFNAAQLKVLRDNMGINKDFGSTMKSKRGSAFDMINDLGSHGGLDSYRLSALADGSASALKDMATQSKSDIREYAELAKTLRAKTDRNEKEEDALQNFDQMYKTVHDENTSDQYALAIRGDTQKLKAWDGIEKENASSNGASQEGEVFSVRQDSVGSSRASNQYEVSSQPSAGSNGRNTDWTATRNSAGGYDLKINPKP